MEVVLEPKKLAHRVHTALLVSITLISLKPDGQLIVLVLTTKKQFLQVSL
jgi:hypothetical protein